MKLTVTTVPPVPVAPEKRYVLELSGDDIPLLLHLAGCWSMKENCQMSDAAKAFASNLFGVLANNPDWER